MAPVAQAESSTKTIADSQRSTFARVNVGAAAKAAVSTQGAVAAQATLTCKANVGFSRYELGALYRVTDSNVLGGAGTMTQSASPVGSGWSGSAFAWIASGGDGVLYALTWAGDLKWYKWTGTAWGSGSGAVVGKGFTPRTAIINIALGTDGRFYVVKTNGSLVIYRHSGRLTGAATWSNGAGWVIGTGWTGNEILTPTGDGTIYRQYAGSLYWYRHSDPALGAVTWSARKTIGSGWNFYDILSAGGGVIYATSGGDGKVYQFRHNDPVGGTNTWAASTGVLKMTANANSFGITSDPYACTLA